MQRLRQRRVRELAAGLGAMVISVVAVAATVWINIAHIERADADVREAGEELAWADAVLDSVSDQNNALRGAIRTRDRSFVEPYREGQTRFAHALDSLTAFAADDPPLQRADVEHARRLAMAWRLKVADPQIAAVEAGRASSPITALNGDDVATIERAIDDLRNGEMRLLQARERTLSASFAISRWTLVVGSTLALAFALLIVGGAFAQLIQERRLLEESAAKLSAALEGAQAAERAKVRFLGNMSHEMRTPLNGVSGLAEALARTTLSAKQCEWVDAIRSSAAILDHLIGDLLALARGETPDAEKYAQTRFHLNPAVAAAARPFAIEAAAESLTFEVDAGDDADIDVERDAENLAEVLAQSPAAS
jgi:signal transduction histidine kinase